YFETDIARHRNATLEGVRDAVARYLNTDNRLLVRFHPETSIQRAAGIDVDRSKVPQLGVDTPITVPEVKAATLENGLSVFVVERPELPKVAVRFVARAGAAADPKAKEGLANLAVTTMTRGTVTRSAVDIEASFSALGTNISSEIDRERATLSFDVLKRSLAPAIDTLA